MHRIQLFITAGVCLAGLILSGMWLWTGHKSWQGFMLERRVEQSQPVTAVALLEVWEESRGLERTILPGRHVHLTGLTAQLLVQEQEIDPGRRADVLVQGLEAARHALGRDPAEAHAWARKAWMEYALNGVSPEVISSLRMSVYCMPAGRSLVFWRIRMSGLNRQFWDEDFEALLRRQIIYAWRISPQMLARTAVEKEMEELARQVLSRSPEDLQRFEELAGSVSR